MAKRRKSQARRMPSVDEVLAGKIDVDVDTLMGLVVRVNPTERGLTPRETTRRYAQKAQLQSLMIRRFGERLTVEPTLGDPATVGIHLRGAGPDNGTHARLDALDDSARAWVQFALDLAQSVDEPKAGSPSWREPPKPAADGLTGDPRVDSPALLRRGQAALATYDYEEAQRCFEAALERSGRAAEPARALLELLVDHLAADSEALSVGESLPDAVATDPAVRALLGLAAARAGRHEQSRSWVRGLTAPRVVEVWATLAQGAIDAGDLTAATEAYDEGLLIAPSAPELVAVGDGIAQLSQSRRRPLEQALLETFASGRLDDAQAEAQALLSAWPGSEVAPRILGEINQTRRAVARQTHLDSGLEALSQEAFETALRHFEAARKHDAPAQMVEGPMAAARAGVERNRRRAQLQTALTLLEQGDRKIALLGWLELAPDLRAEIADQHPWAAFEWLDQADAPPSGALAKAAVAAVLALEEAQEALERREPQIVLATLGPHERWLSNVERAREVADTARSQLEELERIAARDALIRAIRIADEGDLRAALEAFKKVDGDRLDESARNQLVTLRSAVRAELDRARLSSRLTALENNRAFLEARAVADQLLTQAPESERPRWQARRDRVVASLMHQWAVRSFDFEPYADDARDVSFQWSTECVSTALVSEGQRLITIQFAHDRAFIREWDVKTARTHRAAVVKLPVLDAHFDKFVDKFVDEESIWLHPSTQNIVVQIDLATFEPLQVIALAEFLQPGWYCDHIALVPGTSLVWMFTAPKGEVNTDVQIVDMTTRRVVRALTDTSQASVVPSDDGPRVIRVRDSAGLSIHEGAGRRLSWDTESVSCRLNVGVPAGDGEGVVLVTCDPPPSGIGDWRDDAPIALIYLAPNGMTSRPWVVTDSVNSYVHTVAGSREAECVFVYFQTGYESPHNHYVAAITVAPDGGQEHWRCLVEGDVELVTDSQCDRVVAVVYSREGPRIVPLTRIRPELPQAPNPPTVPYVAFSGDCFAENVSREESRQIGRKAAELAERSLTQCAQMWTACLEDPTTRAADVFVLAKALHRKRRGDLSRRVIREGLKRFPDDCRLLLRLAADELIPKNRWREIGHHFEPIYDQTTGLTADLAPEGSSAAACDRAHVCHLVGLARAHANDLPGALEAWRRGLNLETMGTCHLDHLVDFAEQVLVLEGPGASTGEVSATKDEILEEVRVAALVRRASAREVPRAQVDLLDRRPVWSRGDQPTFARLVDAWLEWPESNPVRQFRQLHAAAKLLELSLPTGHQLSHVPTLPLPTNLWNQADLDRLVVRTNAWLDAQQPEIFPSPPEEPPEEPSDP